MMLLPGRRSGRAGNICRCGDKRKRRGKTIQITSLVVAGVLLIANVPPQLQCPEYGIP